jgi:hypothetical protein
VSTASRLLAVRTQRQRRPRQVKRRNSPYASYDRHLQRSTPIDPTPTMLSPKALCDPVRPRSVARWAGNKSEER